MIFGSVCSGIEAASCAWDDIGIKPVWYSEIDAFPSQLLSQRWPHVKNVGDMYSIVGLLKDKRILPPNILIGGTPCQSFSRSGQRESLDDSRGMLSIEYCNILNTIDRLRLEKGLDESICVWENVKGVLGTKDNAFGIFISTLAGEILPVKFAGGKWPNVGAVFGPKRTVAWRVLDTKYFGVAQQRKRVFVVATANKNLCPLEILFEFDGSRNDTAPLLGETEGNRPVSQICFRKVSHTVFTRDKYVSTIRARDFKDFTDLIIENHTFVRRLIPIEYERLQGFCEGYTNIEGANDRARIKALGNSMSVPVIKWLGERILLAASKTNPSPSKR